MTDWMDDLMGGKDFQSASNYEDPIHDMGCTSLQVLKPSGYPPPTRKCETASPFLHSSSPLPLARSGRVGKKGEAQEGLFYVCTQYSGSTGLGWASLYDRSLEVASFWLPGNGGLTHSAYYYLRVGIASIFPYIVYNVHALRIHGFWSRPCIRTRQWWMEGRTHCVSGLHTIRAVVWLCEDRDLLQVHTDIHIAPYTHGRAQTQTTQNTHSRLTSAGFFFLSSSIRRQYRLPAEVSADVPTLLGPVSKRWRRCGFWSPGTCTPGRDKKNTQGGPAPDLRALSPCLSADAAARGRIGS